MKHNASMINPTFLTPSIKYPAPVAKAYAEQQTAEKAYVTAQAELAEAEANVAIAEAEDQRALTEAASKGTGHPGSESAPAARRAYEYADEVAHQTQQRFIDTTHTTRTALSQHVNEIIPIAIANVRTAVETFDDKMASIHRILDEANHLMQDAAYGLNQLQSHTTVTYKINYVPATISTPQIGSMTNMAQVANQLEAILREEANPTPKPDHWPVTHNTWENSDTPRDVHGADDSAHVTEPTA